MDDVFSLLLHLYEGAFQLPKRAELECPGTGTPPAASCATAAFTIEGGPSSARIGLVAPDLDVQGWSLSVRAEGCTIASATTAGTAGASRWSDPDGARDTGYDATFVDADGATSAVLLGLVDDVVLPSPDGVDVLALALTPEGRSCGPCELTVGAPIATLGEEVEAIVVASGARYASAPVTASFEVCAP